MNRRQRRALAKRFPGYKKLLNEAKEKTFEQFKEMLEKSWSQQGAETTGIESLIPGTPQFNKTIEEQTNKESPSEAKNAEGEQNETS